MYAVFLLPRSIAYISVSFDISNKRNERHPFIHCGQPYVYILQSCIHKWMWANAKQLLVFACWTQNILFRKICEDKFDFFHNNNRTLYCSYLYILQIQWSNLFYFTTNNSATLFSYRALQWHIKFWTQCDIFLLYL